MGDRYTSVRGRGRNHFDSPTLKDDEGKPLRYHFRKLSQMDMGRVGIFGLAKLTRDLRTNGNGEEETKEEKIAAVVDNPDMLLGLGSNVQQVLETAVFDPKIQYKWPADEGCLHISDIAEDEMPLYMAVMEFAGVSSTTKTEVEATLEKKVGAEPLTGSPTDTESSLTKS